MNMDIVNYLSNIYGYGTPIFLKDLRIGRKSKSAIREELYRAVKRGDLTRDANGIYSVVEKNHDFPRVVTFEKILKWKFIHPDCAPGFEELFVEGYYSGLSFVNQIGISQQVPAILEVTTNRTSSKKRYFVVGKRVAVIRKSRTEITFQNYKMLQFLDMFHFVTMNEVKKYRNLIRKYIQNNHLSKYQFQQYIKFYGTDTIKKIVEGGIIDAFVE